VSPQARVQASKAGPERPQPLTELAELADEYERRANYCQFQLGSDLRRREGCGGRWLKSCRRARLTRAALQGANRTPVPAIFPTIDM
jgi:hypothetical protein